MSEWILRPMWSMEFVDVGERRGVDIFIWSCNRVSGFLINVVLGCEVENGVGRNSGSAEWPLHSRPVPRPEQENCPDLYPVAFRV